MPRRPRDSESSPSAATSLRNRAFRNPRAVALFVALGVLAGALDLWTKHLAFTRLMETPSLTRQVETILQDNFGTTRPAQSSPELTRDVLRLLHVTKKICFGLSFTLSTNPGIAFGKRWFPLGLVNLITIFMMLFVTGFFLLSERRHYWLHAALALLVGGAFGNLFDRLCSYVPLPNLPPIRYHVRDFIDCSELGYPWVFNLADAWLVIGAVMIIAYWFWTGRKARRLDAAKKS